MSTERTYFVYLLASQKNGTLYCGVTSDLPRRTFDHREGNLPGFTSKYGVKRLVWYEVYTDIHEAIRREKRIKKWPRDWKINLIEANNPDWNDLWKSIL
ncbi:excinuclease ABC subunit C [Glycocaulis albus]|uniref:Excinuclease ABC subunit C n=1 Tax=Glycocaulis albus TaxID=1382801 RepID=A0ABQ1XU19_9PROT|nr:GIY-YIG nuclease family protein [Glycocaulis albus]MBV5258869.1 GIY-YIG nuclease family protein [Synechococcus moorigangaii CMS01]GGH03360.1 excinuclease ABC subunit C [Glycocaulis albus]